MIFEVRCQSFKILLVMVVLVGSAFVGKCEAERNPVSLERRNFCQELVGSESTDDKGAIEQDRQRIERSWADFKLFASEQAALAKQKWASLELEKWWNRRRELNVSPTTQQRPARIVDTSTTSVSAMVVNYAANMNAMQWWQASNRAAELLDSCHHQVAQATNKLETDLHASMIQLVELTSSNIIQLANSHRALQRMSVIENPDSTQTDSLDAMLSSDSSPVAGASTNEDEGTDPYWQYYADCDFWGAQFEATNQ